MQSLVSNDFKAQVKKAVLNLKTSFLNNWSTMMTELKIQNPQQAEIS